MSADLFIKKTEDALINELGEEGKKYISHFVEAFSYLNENIYGEIKGKEPGMSDHGTRHVKNVLKNVHFLLDKDYTNLSAINLYCLGVIVLFHDVGNIEGREDHHKKIANVYNQVRNKKPEFDQERLCVIKAAGAHTGFSAKDGSRDTLKDVPLVEHIDGYKINLRELAAVLRFADECAEGYQRTSDYLNATDAFKEENKIYQWYAKVTNVFIDKGDNRIVLKYNLDITKEEFESGEVKKMIEFIFKRIIKLDIERRYCKHYTPLLYNFKVTEATINFLINGEPIDYSLENIRLEDKFPLPKKAEEITLDAIEEINVEYKLVNIMTQLSQFFNPKENVSV